MRELHNNLMKIGIVSDIHAHIDPLKRAISLFESQDVTQIICAGDLVDGGWDDEAVIDLIRSRNILSVRGNHDRNAFLGEIEQWDIDVDVDSDFGDLLNSYKAQYVSSLPMTRQFNWEDMDIFLAHGSPWSDTDHVFPNTSADMCNKILTFTKANIVILGHTHIPMKLQINDKWILNPGALCGNRANSQRTCGILDLPQGKFEVFDTQTSKPVKLETKIINS